MPGATITSEFFGVKEVQQALSRATIKLDATIRLNVATLSSLLIRQAMNNFEGAHRRNQPRVPNAAMKPNIVTGTLRRSIRSDGIKRYGFGIYGTTVGPSTVYGRRVELGFAGTDSRGRTYNQPAYPYFGPAVKVARVQAATLMGASITPAKIF